MTADDLWEKAKRAEMELGIQKGLWVRGTLKPYLVRECNSAALAGFLAATVPLPNGLFTPPTVPEPNQLSAFDKPKLGKLPYGLDDLERELVEQGFQLRIVEVGSAGATYGLEVAWQTTGRPIPKERIMPLLGIAQKWQ